MIKKMVYREYEEKAQRVINHFYTEPVQVPIDIEHLISLCDIDIIPLKNLRNDFNAKGLIVRNPRGGFDIIIDQDHWYNDEFYYRFTLAEELAHILLHVDYYKTAKNVTDVVSIHNSMSEDEYRMMEQQARNTGSYLLFPRISTLHFFEDWIRAENGNLVRNSSSRTQLCEYVAEELSPILCTSSATLKHILLYRYPEPLLIDSIISRMRGA